MAQPPQQSCRATLCHTTFFAIGRGVAGASRCTLKGPCSTYLFSSYRGCRTSSCRLEGVAAQGGVATTLSASVACCATVGYSRPLREPVCALAISPSAICVCEMENKAGMPKGAARSNHQAPHPSKEEKQEGEHYRSVLKTLGC